MTSVSRHSLIFIFLLISVLGFAEKALAYVAPEIYTSIYTEGSPVTVWVSCGSYFRGGIVGYFLDRTPPSPLTSDSLYDTPFYNGEAKYDYDTCGGLFSDLTGTLNLGVFGVGTHTIHAFFINSGGYTDSSGYPLDDVAGYFSKTFNVCVSNYGSSCAHNSCGDPNGYIQCDGSCSAGPVERSYYNQPCSLTSATNACGQTTTVYNVGLYDCDRSCIGATPSAPPVTVPPVSPSVSGPSRVPAWNKPGYDIYATGAACDGTNVTQYFEFSKDGVNWTGDYPGFPASSWATRVP